MIAFINVDYIRHSRFGMNFALNKCQKLFFSMCHKGVHFRWNEGVGSHFSEDDISMKYDYNIDAKFNW